MQPASISPFPHLLIQPNLLSLTVAIVCDRTRRETRWSESCAGGPVGVSEDQAGGVAGEAVNQYGQWEKKIFAMKTFTGGRPREAAR